jgi:hypothetical protein
MVDFHATLVNNTPLYGVVPRICPSKNDISGNKSDWNDPTKGKFFPGYSAEVLDAATNAAKPRMHSRDLQLSYTSG